MNPQAVAGPPSVAGGFSLVDHYGRNVDDKTYRGRYVLILFGFTHCQVVCPRNLTKLSQVLNGLGSLAERVCALYITVDPARDTPQVMRAFLEKQSYARFIGLTGSPESIREVLAAFRVFARRRDQEDGGYQMPHSAFTYLLDPHGRFVGHWPATMEADDMVFRLARLLAD
jgi:protein SCO1